MKKFPNALVIMLAAILLAWTLTYLIPQGEYERITDPTTEQTSVVGGSYHPISAEPPGVFDLMLAIPRGIAVEVSLLVLILLLGGCFYVVERSGALGMGLQWVADLLQGREGIGLVVLSLLFTAAGATIGLQEEIIALTPILVLFSRSMGYNTFMAVATSYGSAVLGSAFSPMNPFAVLLAQKEAQLPLLSGGGFRMVILIIAFALWTAYLQFYARKNRIPKVAMQSSGGTLSWKAFVILALLVLTFSIVTYGLLALDWGFEQISACFFVLGLSAGLLSGMGLNGTTATYAKGMREMTSAAVIIGLARSISLLLEEGRVMDTIIFNLFTPMEALPKSLSAVGMMASQALLHFPVSSYSGQALLTMPILAPLSDLVGLSRQVCVLAYQYGAVNMDLVVPTNGALMAVLAIAGIPYNKWVRFVWRPLLLLLAVASLALIAGVFLNI